MSKLIVLEPVELMSDVSSCLFVKDFPACPPGYMVVWDTEFHCHDCGGHLYEIVNRKIEHECRTIDAEGKDRPVLDAAGEKTHYYEDAYLILCPRCITYRPDDRRLGEFDHREMVVTLYDRPRAPEADQLRPHRRRPAPPASAPADRFLARWRPIPPESLAQLDYYLQDLKASVLSRMHNEAVKAARRPDHKARPRIRRKRTRLDPEFGSDYTYGSVE